MSKTNEELDALEALAKAATPGPWLDRWAAVADDNHPAEITIAGADGRLVVGILYWNGDHVACRRGDAAYIAAACNAVPSLIAEVRELRRERDEWHDAAARAHDALTDLDVSERAALSEAADLRAENERLRTALQRMHNNVGVPWLREAAREALRGK